MFFILVLYAVLGICLALIVIGQAALGKAYLENRLRLPPQDVL